MNHIDVSTDQKTVSVGPAAVWNNVYQELERYERTVVGGRVAGVGVAGLLIGGKSVDLVRVGVCAADYTRGNVAFLERLGHGMRQRRELRGMQLYGPFGEARKGQ
jgi:hypothetical protein